jgi:UDP-glucose 4-epimerase
MLLVTGGAGFIGSHLVRAALASGWAVRVLDDLSTGDKRNVADAAELVEGDVADPEAVARALDGATAVAHLAAHRAVPRSLIDPISVDRANTGGTLTVLEQARRNPTTTRVVLASSSSVYGDAATRATPTPETTPPAPRSPYAVSKLAGEHYARVYNELHGLSTLSLRLFNVYGPGQPADGPYAQLVPRVLHDPVVTIDGDGTQSRDLVFVTDVARAFIAALARPDVTGVLNIGTGRSYTVNEVVAAAGRSHQSQHDQEVVHGPARRADVAHTCADATRAAQQLDWRPLVTLEDGLALTRAAS